MAIEERVAKALHVSAQAVPNVPLSAANLPFLASIKGPLETAASSV